MWLDRFVAVSGVDRGFSCTCLGLGVRPRWERLRPKGS